MRFPACSFCGETHVQEDAEGYRQRMVEALPTGKDRRARARICLVCLRHPEGLSVVQTIVMKDGRGLKAVADAHAARGAA